MKSLLLASTVVMAAALSLGLRTGSESQEGGQERSAEMKKTDNDLRTATFAGGCFWCIEADFEKTDGVVEAISGYSGGHEEDPTYEEVAAGGTSHAEAVQVAYDDDKHIAGIDLVLVELLRRSRIARIAVHADILVVQLRDYLADFFSGFAEVFCCGTYEYFHERSLPMPFLSQ